VFLNAFNSIFFGMGIKDLRYVHEVQFSLGSAYRGYHLYNGKKRKEAYIISVRNTKTDEVSIMMSEKYIAYLGMETAGLHCLYVSRHLSVKPMEFCGTNVTEFPSYIIYISD
jgi:hypothetical protein